MSHEEASELLPSFALNAVKPDEFALIQEHVVFCPHCQAEMDAYHEVTAALGNSVTPLPVDLWESIARDLVVGDERRAESLCEAAPLRLVRGASSARIRFVMATSAAMGAAAVITVLGIGLANANNQVAHLQGAVRVTARTQMTAALQAADHKVVDLTSADHQRLAQFVLLPSGRGYLVQSQLPALPLGETYQLWGVTDGKTVSLGILGRRPRLATFTSAGSAPSYLGVTVEAAGGAVQPSGIMLASGAA